MDSIWGVVRTMTAQEDRARIECERQGFGTFLPKFRTYVVARNGRRFRMFHRETDAAKVARNRDTIFDLHAASLEWLERYIVELERNNRPVKEITDRVFRIVDINKIFNELTNESSS